MAESNWNESPNDVCLYTLFYTSLLLLFFLLFCKNYMSKHHDIGIENQSRNPAKGNILVLVLVGLQGAGKTFLTRRLKEKLQQDTESSQVDTATSRPLKVVGINQDVIRRDFPWLTATRSKKLNGSREDCVKVFQRECEPLAFDDGRLETEGDLPTSLVLVIDRTNLTVEQRRTWVDQARILRGKGCNVSLVCLFLDVPVSVCSVRAAQRQNHEGHVHGQKAYPIVYRCNGMLQRPDAISEGFDKVFTITSDEQADLIVDIVYDTIGRGNFDSETLKRFHLDLDDTVFIPEKKLKKEVSRGNENAFDVLMKSAKQEALRKQENKVFSSSGGSNRWQDALVWYAKTHFDTISSLVEYSDDLCVIIRDKYPKAKIHLLCIARDLSLREPLDIEPCHTDLLKHMKKMSLNVLERMNDGQIRQGQCQMGFHAVPSMKQLHLHVISTDFDSPGLKTRKHWISFTNKDFFLDIDTCIKSPPRYSIGEKKELLKKAPLICPRCLGSDFKSLTTLLDHYRHNKCSEDSLKRSPETLIL